MMLSLRDIAAGKSAASRLEEARIRREALAAGYRPHRQSGLGLHGVSAARRALANQAAKWLGLGPQHRTNLDRLRRNLRQLLTALDQAETLRRPIQPSTRNAARCNVSTVHDSTQPHATN